MAVLSGKSSEMVTGMGRDVSCKDESQCGGRSLLQNVILIQLTKKLATFKEPESSLPSSQTPPTGPYS
jgi:hypothetical protein